MKSIVLVMTIAGVALALTFAQAATVNDRRPHDKSAAEILDGPVFINAGHYPEYPTSLDSIVFSCEVTDDGEVVRVSLNYRFNLGSWEHIAMAADGDNSYSFGFPPLMPGLVINYTMEAEDDDGLIAHWPDSSCITIVIDGPIAIDEPAQLPLAASLGQNCPNPFNSSTNIYFTLAEASQAKLAIYNVLGQEIKILADGLMPGGNHEFQFDARGLPSGIYFYRLDTDGQNLARRMIILK